MLSRAAYSIRCFKPCLMKNGLSNVAKACSRRCEHTATTSAILIDDAKLLAEVPNPPSLLDETQFELQTKILQDTLSHFGLDSYWPSGLVRMGLQSLQLSTGLPWWEVIALSVLASRLALLPFTVINMRVSAKMKQHQPVLKEYIDKMNESRKAGDMMALQLAQFQMLHYQRKMAINIFKPLLANLPQGLYFFSFFLAIKRMASAPLESLKTGGTLWFVDLTATDPTWILSIVCSASLAVALRTGVDFALPTQSTRMANILFTAIPLSVLFTTHFFPSAVVLYWMTSNSVSLLLAGVFKIPRVRRALKLPLPPAKLKPVKKPFMEPQENKDTSFYTRCYTLCKTMWETITGSFSRPVPSEASIRKSDETAFRKAGQGPVIATYSYNPKERFPEAFSKQSTLEQIFKWIAGKFRNDP